MKQYKNLVIVSKTSDNVIIGVLENGKIAYTETVGLGGGAFFFNNSLYYINDFM